MTKEELVEQIKAMVEGADKGIDAWPQYRTYKEKRKVTCRTILAQTEVLFTLTGNKEEFERSINGIILVCMMYHLSEGRIIVDG